MNFKMFAGLFFRFFVGGSIFMTTTSTLASDLGFRYHDGKCVNAQGAAGLNPSFFGPCADLRGAVLGRLNFDGIDFSGSQFTGAEVQKSSFSKANLTGTNFDGANLAGDVLDQALLTHASFKGAVLKNVSLFETVLDNLDLSQADFRTTNLSSVVFQACVLRGAHFESVTADHADFSKTDLTGAFFSKTNLSSANLSETVLDGTDFDSAVIHGARLNQSHGDKTIFSYADLVGADLSGAALTNAVFLHAKLASANLKGANLAAANLRNVDMTGCMTDQTNLKSALYNKASVLPFSLDVANQLGMIFIKLDCTAATEVEYDGKCYYLDGTGGKCSADYELGPQSIFLKIATMFKDKNYKSVVSSNCCIWHSLIDSEKENYGFEPAQCNEAGPFSTIPILGGTGCNNANNREANQLTLCQTKD